MFSFEYEAVRFILTTPRIARRTAPYVRARDFDFAGLAAEARSMSGGEALLVGVARELWLAEKHVGLWELVRRLDAGDFARVVAALTRARGIPAPAAEAEAEVRLAA